MNAFEALGLIEQLVQAITDLGFETPTSIQEKAIPVLLSGTTDIIGLAQTGTGKTAAFGFPLLQLIDQEQRHPQALIVCPTRELCLQITNDLDTYKKHSRGVFTEAVYGGASIMMQIRNLKKGVQIVVATPGRLIDLIERKAIDLQKVKYVVLDEADEMLNMGFRDDIDFVLKNTINRESTWLFSATMPPEVRAISRNYMDNPKEVTVGKKNSGNVNIDHQFFVAPAQYRYETLKRLIDFNPGMVGGEHPHAALHRVAPCRARPLARSGTLVALSAGDRIPDCDAGVCRGRPPRRHAGRSSRSRSFTSCQ